MIFEWFDFVPDTFMYSGLKKKKFPCCNFVVFTAESLLETLTWRMNVLCFHNLGAPRYNLGVLLCY